MIKLVLQFTSHQCMQSVLLMASLHRLNSRYSCRWWWWCWWRLWC